jgi:hypothetical protein
MRQRNMGRPQLRWMDQYTVQEDGTDEAWPNPRTLWWW